MAAAFRQLGRRERTVAEIRDHLGAKGFEPDLVEAAVMSLGEQGYLDDARFAAMFVQDKRELDGWGSERIARALRQRGLSREHVEGALDHGPAAELEAAVALLRRRWPDPPADRRERERALGMLLRKGYESELALDALNAHTRSARAATGGAPRA